MKCPKCESENTQRLEVVFHGGTQNINTTSASVGGAMRGGLLGAVTKTSGQSQSVLAQAASPPVKKKIFIAIAIMFFGYLIFHVDGMPPKFIGTLVFFGGAYLYYTIYKFNKTQWPALRQHWQDSWLCHKCGTIYHQA